MPRSCHQMLVICAAQIFIAAAVPAPAPAEENPASAVTDSKHPQSTIELFNGRDLTGWVPEGTKEFKDASGKTVPVWSVQDGLLNCRGNGFGFLRYDREFCDFALHIEYRMSKGCNSGIGIRHKKFVKSEDRPSYTGYEIQILDDGGKQPSAGSTASLYRHVAPKSIPAKAAGEWNTIEIECVGPRIKITLNGELIQDVDQTTVKAIAEKPLCGYISVQNHGKGIDFRNLRIKDLQAKQE